MIDQVKIGGFLRTLRKEKGKTQEEIAELFGVSSRSVSRWENGNTMPDLGMLVELADFYGVDIREIIDGERRSEIVTQEIKETLLKVADYAEKEKKQTVNRKSVLTAILSGAIVLLVAALVGLAAFKLYFAQYNINGLSNLLNIYIDESREKAYVGDLEGHRVYTERMRADEMYFISFSDDHIPLADAISTGLISIRDWQRAAWRIDYDGDTEVLVYENYEIIVTEDECIIRPLTDRPAATVWEAFTHSLKH